MNKLRVIGNDLVKYYEIDLTDYLPLTSKAFRIVDKTGKQYFVKETLPNTLEKYQFLYNQGLTNILYPLKNYEQKFVTRNPLASFYVSNFYDDTTIISEPKAQHMLNELDNLHEKTSFKRQLNPMTSRPKFEELTNRLDYKFKMLENYIRSVEAKPLNMYSMPVLANYQYVLDAKKELVRLQKRIISSIKAKDSIDYSFVHNNPQLEHTINYNGSYYLISLDNGKIGIESLDFAKFYIENENLNLDFKNIFINHFKGLNPFYYDYFRYLVLLIYISRLDVASDEYINAEIFISTTNSIKKYFTNFQDVNEDDE